jgi:1-acyl-sn-glycerol-3-phosphate acyltransferase
MADHQPDDTGATVELVLADLRAQLPAADPADLRAQLPGVEAERRLTDWGRSERVERALDRTVYDFLYHYWFRVEVEGIENVPSEGGALLIANRAGTIPSDGAMIAKAVGAKHLSPRPVHLISGSDLKCAPGVVMLLTKAGLVSPHPANLHRLLFDEQALALAFPEGPVAARKPLRERYRLRRFAGAGLIESAIRAQVPIVPVAVLGAEESQPALGRLGRLRRAARIPALPGPPLPAKFRIRFLEPARTADFGERAWEDRKFVQALTEDLRALIQENLLELVADRRSVWFG